MEGFPIRRLIVGLTVGSFSLAALMGVIALLSGGVFGENEGNVLLTTLVVGVTSVAVLCYLAVGDNRYRSIGVLGGVTSLAPLVISLILIWTDLGLDDSAEWLWKTFIVGLVLAATLAQICLLLGLSSSRHVIGWILWSTVALAALLAAVLSFLIIAEADLGDLGARLIGVTAILDALGTVVAIAMAIFGGRPASPAAAGDGVVRLPAPLAARVAEVAAARGRTPDEVVAEAVQDQLGGP